MERAGELRALYGRAYVCDLVDMLIAATALEQNATLLALNMKHFRFIVGLTVQKPYGISPTI
jgi:predicted nucleic acid-binding protein